ncbi:MAG: ABC transporter permease [Zavarzinella sp.]
MATEIQPLPDQAPSRLQEDAMSFTRTVGLTGFVMTVVGVAVLVFALRGVFSLDPHIGLMATVLGTVMMLFHASRDTDPTVTTLYGYGGGMGLPIVGLGLAIAFSMIKAKPDDIAAATRIESVRYLYSWFAILLGLLFLVIYCRNEQDADSRKNGLMMLGGSGMILFLVAVFGSHFRPAYSLGFGLPLGLLGVGYLAAFLVQSGEDTKLGYRGAWFVTLLGLATMSSAMLRAIIPHTLPFFVPAGMLVLGIGLLAALVGLFMASDLQVVVLARRELLTYFYSPIAYAVLLLMAVIGWLAFYLFAQQLFQEVPEPIVMYYLGDYFGVVPVLFIIPAITMRLISEEKRTGTFDMMMSAPVKEWNVVLSKLFASFIFFMLTMSIYAIYLVALVAETGTAFEFRTLLSFYLAVAVTGLAFLSLGLFLSSLTNNQMVAAVLTFGAMLFLFAIFFLERLVPPTSPFKNVFLHTSYVHFWWSSLRGHLHVRDLLIQLTLAGFWTFLSVRVLEARRWW